MARLRTSTARPRSSTARVPRRRPRACWLRTPRPPRLRPTAAGRARVNGVHQRTSRPQRGAAVRAGRRRSSSYRLLVEGLPVIPYRDALGRQRRRCTSARGSRSCWATPPQQWLAGGLEWWLRLVHPDDLLSASAGRPRRASSGSRRCRSATGCRHAEAELALVRRRGDRRPRRRRPSRSTARACCATSPPRSSAHAAPRARPSSASGRWSSSCRWRSTSTSPTATFTNIYISPQIERMLGYPVDAVDGQPARCSRRVLHPEGPRAGAGRAAGVAGPGRQLPAASTACGTRRTATRSGSREDGDRRHRRRRAAPLYTQGYLEDITERRQAECGGGRDPSGGCAPSPTTWPTSSSSTAWTTASSG